ncbi:MAG: hypothetical protein AB7F86_07745 [Bdellovibrionales bacterium]
MSQLDEAKVKEVLGRVPEQGPSPFFAARVVARAGLGEKSSAAKEVWIWKWIAGISLTAALALVVALKVQSPSTPQEMLFTYQPYVIQVDFEAEDTGLVASAEVILPEGVSFVSKNKVVRSLRQLRLPISDLKDGKLPFVLVAEKEGEFAVLVKMYGESDEVVRTKVMNFHFAQGSQG